jgi:protease II
VYEENDPQFYVDISITKDQKFLVISSGTKMINEIHVLDRG